MNALRYAFSLLALSLVLSGRLPAQSTNDTTSHFRAVDIFVDPKTTPLAAYQLEFTVTNANAKIVGIEGGEHRAFAEPPFYDPKAMQHKRVILAAFSTNPAEKLPTGKTRVATIHLQVSVRTEPRFESGLQTAAGPDGRKIEAAVTIEERKKS